MDQNDTSPPSTGESRGGGSPREAKGPYLSWPPPGLEALQGRLRPLIAFFAIGDAVLVLPLLWSVATEQQIWSLGPFGDAWRVPVFIFLVGLVILVAGFERLFRLVWLGGHAAKHGHGWITILQVAADSPRDTGFLLQGVRAYSVLDLSQRKTLLLLRLVGEGGYLAAVLWIPFGFAISVMLAARGVFGPPTVWFFTLAPPLVLLIVAVLSRSVDYFVRRLARGGRGGRDRRAALDEEIRAQVTDWSASLAEVGGGLGPGSRSANVQRAFRLGAAAVILLALAIVIPVGALSLTGALSSVLVAIAVPDFSSVHVKLAAADALRPYRLERDAAISARDAGEALHSLLSVGTVDRIELPARTPIRLHKEGWFPTDEDSVIKTSKRDWAFSLFERGRQGLGRTELAYLRRVASHPAHRELETVARAGAADITGTRYVLPLPDTLSPFELPIPRFSATYRGADAHLAKAALELSEGHGGRAEETVREVISVGFVLIDDGTTLIDNLIGANLVNVGAEALEKLYRATGRTAEAEDLRGLRNRTRDLVERAVFPGTKPDLESALRAMPQIVLDETVVMGIRWEFFMLFNTLAPCLNLQKVVFGPGESYEQWLENARQTLVRRESDEELFRFLRRSDLAVRARTAPGWFGRLAKMSFGGGSASACASGFASLW